jgi:hypothetical protein
MISSQGPRGRARSFGLGAGLAAYRFVTGSARDREAVWVAIAAVLALGTAVIDPVSHLGNRLQWLGV